MDRVWKRQSITSAVVMTPAPSERPCRLSRSIAGRRPRRPGARAAASSTRGEAWPPEATSPQSPNAPQTHQNEVPVPRSVWRLQSPSRARPTPSGVNARTNRDQPTTLIVSGSRMRRGRASSARSSDCRQKLESRPPARSGGWPKIPEHAGKHRRANRQEVPGLPLRPIIQKRGINRKQDVILIAIPREIKHQPAARRRASALERMIPAGEPGDGRAEHRRIWLEGPAILDRQRKDRKDQDGEERDPNALAPSRKQKEPPRRQRRAKGRDNSTGLHQSHGCPSIEHDRQSFDYRRLNHEVIRERSGLDLPAPGVPTLGQDSAPPWPSESAGPRSSQRAAAADEPPESEKRITTAQTTDPRSARSLRNQPFVRRP